MFWNKWKKKNTAQFKCSSCGEVHEGLPALGFETPFHYNILSDKDKVEKTEVDSDFCIIRYPEQTDRFIRATLQIQINDACEGLDYGIWVSLSEKSFNDYKANFKDNKEGKTYFGTICNKIPHYQESTIGLHVDVNTRSGGLRPEIVPHQSEHRLVRDWEKGITIGDAENRIEKAIK